MKKKLTTLAVIMGILLLASVFLVEPTLRLSGNLLIVEKPPKQAQTTFILSGGAFDRGNKAAELYHARLTSKMICTGNNQPPDFKALRLEMLESELTRLHITKLGVPENHIQLLKQGTSTREEAELILSYCTENQLSAITIVSSKFHTRRVHRVFRKAFADSGVAISIVGAPSSFYDEKFWWQSENGLIALNNEYIKLIYYWLKY